MVISVAVLAVSAALFFFYIQALSQKILRQEFIHPYFREVVKAARLEYPVLRESYAFNGPDDYRNARLALKYDFFTLKYLLKNSGPGRRQTSRREKILLLYFQLNFFFLPIRHMFNFREKEGILDLTSTLQFFANSLGERLVGYSAVPAEFQVN